MKSLRILQKLDFERKLEVKKNNLQTKSEDADNVAKTAVVTVAAMSAIVASEIAAQNKIDDDVNSNE